LRFRVQVAAGVDLEGYLWPLPSAVSPPSGQAAAERLLMSTAFDPLRWMSFNILLCFFIFGLSPQRYLISSSAAGENFADIIRFKTFSPLKLGDGFVDEADAAVGVERIVCGDVKRHPACLKSFVDEQVEGCGSVCPISERSFANSSFMLLSIRIIV
jgi:hypothetical protein